MPTTVPVTPKSLASYKPFAGEEAIQRIRNLAAPFAGARVLHLNATSFGGGELRASGAKPIGKNKRKHLRALSRRADGWNGGWNGTV